MKKNLTRRNFVATVAVPSMVLSAVPSLAFAQQDSYPSKPIKLIVPLPAGGAADASVRIFAEQFASVAKQPILIDNKPGGIFQIAMQAIAQSPADGYSLIHLNTGMVSAQVVNGKFDLIKQLVPISFMGTTDGILASNPNAPFKTTRELVEWAKTNPGKLNYGSAGPGSIEHLATAYFLKKYGLSGTHIPFKGGPDAMTALAQGEIHIFATAVPLVFQFMQKGLVRPLGMLVEKRTSLLPDLPTMKEQGIEFPMLQFWGGLAAPPNTPKAVIEMLQNFTAQSLKVPALQTRFASLGMVPAYSGTEQFTKVIVDDINWMTAASQGLNLGQG
jgi:tripartite-type tricarboxylate transporter receptor subunit TctC